MRIFRLPFFCVAISILGTLPLLSGQQSRGVSPEAGPPQIASAQNGMKSNGGGENLENVIDQGAVNRASGSPYYQIRSLNGAMNAGLCGLSDRPAWCRGSEIGAWTNSAIAVIVETLDVTEPVVVELPDVRVHVGINDPRQQHPPLEVNHPRTWPGQRGGLLIGPDKDESSVGHGGGLRPWSARIEREDFAVHENQFDRAHRARSPARRRARPGACGARARCGTEQQESAQCRRDDPGLRDSAHLRPPSTADCSSCGRAIFSVLFSTLENAAASYPRPLIECRHSTSFTACDRPLRNITDARSRVGRMF